MAQLITGSKLTHNTHRKTRYMTLLLLLSANTVRSSAFHPSCSAVLCRCHAPPASAAFTHSVVA